MEYIRQIDQQSSDKKRVRRFEYIRQRETSRQDYKFGVLNPPEEFLDATSKARVSESTQPAQLYQER